MTKINIVVATEVTITVNEQELGALDAIFGYSVESFLKGFKKELGYAYIQPYEAGVRSLHERIRKITSPALSEIRAARSRINEITK